MRKYRTVKFFKVDWDKTSFEQMIDWNTKNGCSLVGTGKEIDPFNGKTKYIAVFRKRVECK